MPDQPRRVILVLGALAAFAPLATDSNLPALPAIAAALGTGIAAVQGTLAAFFAGVGLGQLLHGPLSDRFGRRPPLFAGLALFTLASIGCAFAQDVETLTWARFVQGFGGCAGTVIPRAIVRDVAAGPAGIRMMSRLILVAGIAPVVAPSLGTALLALGGWRAIYAGLAVYGAAMLVAIAFALPESLPPARRRSDGPRAALGVYADLLRDRRFLGRTLAGVLPLGALFVYIAGSPFVFMTLHGLSPTLYGILFGATAAAFVAAAQLSGWVAGRIPPDRALGAVQAGLAAVGAALLFVAITGWGGAWAFAALCLALLAGCGAAMPLAIGLALAPHPLVAGSASALFGALQFGFGATAVALLGLFADATARPMAALIAALVMAGLALRWRLERAARAAADTPAAAGTG